MTNFTLKSAILLLSSTLLATACSSHKVQPTEPETINNHLSTSAYEPISPADPSIQDEPQVSMAEPNAPLLDATLEEPMVSIATDTNEMPEQPYLVPELPDDDTDTRPAKTLFLFGFDQKQLDQDAEITLKQHGAFLAAHPDLKISINGHADPQGDPTYNQHLAEQRARYVAKLLTQQGVTAEQIEVLSWGADAPVPSATHHRDNRRVELIYSEEYLVNYQSQ